KSEEIEKNRKEDLEAGENRLPIKEVHYNKCPAVAPIGVLNDAAQQRLEIDLDDCLQKVEIIKSQLAKVTGNLLHAHQQASFEPITNPDHALYSGGFFKPSDRNKMEQIKTMGWQALAQSQFNFEDNRLDEMLFRYRARNAPETLSAEERTRWNAFKKSNFFDQSSLLFDELMDKLEALQQDPSNDQSILLDVKTYAQQLVDSLN
ncbi:MAG: hypothetical protein OQJ89_14830, partial [Kangiellaceae bacterium]|nr:hypothetical protein [Kangiellaceae bacterium]